MVLVMSALSFLTRYPPASSGPWLRGVMACQGRNRRLVRDCPTSIDAQMERKVQRVEGDGGEKRPGQAPRVITGYFGSGAGAVWGYLHRYLSIARSNVPCAGAMAGKVDSVNRIQYAKEHSRPNRRPSQPRPTLIDVYPFFIRRWTLSDGDGSCWFDVDLQRD